MSHGWSSKRYALEVIQLPPRPPCLRPFVQGRVMFPICRARASHYLSCGFFNVIHTCPNTSIPSDLGIEPASTTSNGLFTGDTGLQIVP